MSITDLVNQAIKGVSYDVESTKEKQERGTGREAASETTRTVTKTKIILERSALDGPGAAATNVDSVPTAADSVPTAAKPADSVPTAASQLALDDLALA